MESIFRKYDEHIIREQDQIYGPVSSSNLNSVNQTTTFDINGGDSFLNIKKAKYKIFGRVLQTDGTDYPKGSAIKLNDNFVGYLFSRIEVRKHCKLLDSVDNVGRCSLIKGTVSYSADQSGPTINCGFQSKFKGGGYFSATGKLSNLCLGFFKDIEWPVYKGGFEISFIRHTDDDALLRYKNDQGVLAGAGKIIIDGFYIKIPYVAYDDLEKIKLINELTLLSKRNEYMFSFKSWQCIAVGNITGKTLAISISSMYRNVRNPLFAIVSFQTDKLNNQLSDSTVFNHCNLQNIWLDVDNVRYPEQLLNLDFKKENFNDAYDMLMDYKNTYSRLHRDLSLMYIDPQEFKDIRPFFVINMSRQPSQISGYKPSIMLHATFDDDLPNNTICYICLISGTEFFYDLANNTIREDI